MTKKKKGKGLLPNIEIIIIAVFFISFIFIMIPQCESNSEQEQQEAMMSTSVEDSVETENFAVPPPPAPVQEERIATPIAGNPNPQKLYVTIDGINMRKEPNIASRIIRKLVLFEEVYFEGETTEKKKEIDWGGGVITNEPWVKVKTKKDETGWVYGAALHFYKKKFELPEEETTE